MAEPPKLGTHRGDQASRDEDVGKWVPARGLQPTDTPLAQALTDIGLSEYAAAFDQQGYRELADLGDSAEAVKTAVEAVVPEDKPGVVNRIITTWKNDKHAKDAAAAPPEPTPAPAPAPAKPASALGIPKLPAGATLDLTQDTATVNDITFTIPTQLKVSGSTGTVDLTKVEWLTVAKNTKLLYGIHLDQALRSSAEDDARAKQAALVWKVPDSDDFLDPRAEGSVQSSLCYTESLNNLVHHRIVAGQLGIGTPFVSGAAEATRAEKQARSSLNKRLFMTGVWRYTQATLTLQYCTAASPRFLAAIKDALNTPPDQQFNALKKVFDRFGHVAATTVVLGGQLFFQSERTATGSLSTDQVMTTVKAAVEAKKDGVEAAASASFQDGSNTKVTAQEIVESVSFSCVGGDTTLASAPADWAGTVKNPNSWAIIARQGLTHLVDWLDDADKKQVLAIWNDGLKQLWRGHAPPQGYAYPDFHDEPFTITSAAPKQRYGALTYTVPSGFRLGPAVPALQRRALVGASPVTGLSNPAGNALRWRLVYTGATTEGNRKGQPLYWILAYPDQQPQLNQGLIVLAASTFDTTQPVNVAVVMDHGEMQVNKATPENSYATWTITPRNLSEYGSRDTEVAYHYQIQNFKTGLVLGPLYDQLENRQADPKFPKALASFGFALPDLCVTLSPDPTGKTSPGTAWICAPCKADAVIPNDNT